MMLGALQQIASDLRNALDAMEASQTAPNGEAAKAAADHALECLERASDLTHRLIGRFIARADIHRSTHDHQ